MFSRLRRLQGAVSDGKTTTSWGRRNTEHMGTATWTGLDRMRKTSQTLAMFKCSSCFHGMARRQTAKRKTALQQFYLSCLIYLSSNIIFCLHVCKANVFASTVRRSASRWLFYCGHRFENTEFLKRGFSKYSPACSIFCLLETVQSRRRSAKIEHR